MPGGYTPHAALMQLVAQYLPAASGQPLNVVDMGCGSRAEGVHAGLAACGIEATVTGVDLLQPMHLNPLLAQHVPGPQPQPAEAVQWLCADAACTDLADGSAHAVSHICSLLSRGQLLARVDETCRILRPGGICLLAACTELDAANVVAAAELFKARGFQLLHVLVDAPLPHCPKGSWTVVLLRAPGGRQLAACGAAAAACNSERAVASQRQDQHPDGCAPLPRPHTCRRPLSGSRAGAQHGASGGRARARCGVLLQHCAVPPPALAVQAVSQQHPAHAPAPARLPAAHLCRLYLARSLARGAVG